jgi:hypothetical protein
VDTKPKKLDTDFTPNECRVELEKQAGRREVVRARAASAKLEEERHKANEHIIATHAEANGDMLAQKAAQQIVMMMKKKALNVAFDQGVVIPLAPSGHAVAEESSTSSVTSTPSGRPPLQPRLHGCALSRLGDPRITSSEMYGQGIDLNRTPKAGKSSLAVAKKQVCISAADMPLPVVDWR